MQLIQAAILQQAKVALTLPWHSAARLLVEMDIKIARRT
jgi:hypothetical protein